jgi:hypothetical protein
VRVLVLVVRILVPGMTLVHHHRIINAGRFQFLESRA